MSLLTLPQELAGRVVRLSSLGDRGHEVDPAVRCNLDLEATDADVLL